MIAPTLPVYAEDPEAVLKEYPTAIKDKMEMFIPLLVMRITK